MEIRVCIGSSCHLRGSQQIIELMKNAISKHNISEKVELSAAFCLGKCTDGVSIKVDNNVICGVCAENFDEVFSEYVLKRI